MQPDRRGHLALVTNLDVWQINRASQVNFDRFWSHDDA